MSESDLFEYASRSTGDHAPTNGVQGGTLADGSPCYYVKAEVGGKWVPGAAICKGGKFVGASVPGTSTVHSFEVLTSPNKAVYKNGKTGGNAPAGAVEVGEGAGLSFHARATVNGIVIPGKADAMSAGARSLKAAVIRHDGKEHRVHNFEILTLEPY